MKAQGFGHIINTASVAGFMPIPGAVSYSATKHAVIGLSKSLRAETASLGIRVSVLCPGFIRTPLINGNGGVYGRSLDESSESQRLLFEEIEKFKPMAPNRFAIKALRSISKNKAVIVIPSWYKLLLWLHCLFPSIGIMLAKKSFQDMQNKLKE